jgi:hypothetical protein
LGAGNEGYVTIDLGEVVQGTLYAKIGIYIASGTSGNWTLKTSIDDSLYNDLWEITINPATEIQYYISGSFWGRYIAVGAVDTGNGSVSLSGNKEILRL